MKDIKAVASHAFQRGPDLEAALGRYDQAWPGGAEGRAAVEKLASAERREAGSLSLGTVQEVLRWGFGRTNGKLEAGAVRDTTREAFGLAAAGDSTGAIKALSKLPGVGPSAASKLLSLSEPSRFAIYDSRVALGLSDLRDAAGKPMIKTPPGRVVPGSGASPAVLADEYERFLAVLRLQLVFARLNPKVKKLKTVSDIEKAYFVLGREKAIP